MKKSKCFMLPFLKLEVLKHNACVRNFTQIYLRVYINMEDFTTQMGTKFWIQYDDIFLQKIHK